MSLRPSKAAVAEVLEKAADLYESEQIEWCKHQAFRAAPNAPGYKVSACAIGALALAAGTCRLTDRYVAAEEISSVFDERALLSRSAESALGTYLHVNYVPSFNDHPLTTKQDLIDAMKDCAKDLRNQQ